MPLLITLVLLFLLYPVMLELGLVREFRALFIFLMVSAVYSVSGRRRHLIVALALAVPAAIAQGIVLAKPSRWALIAAILLALAFLCYVTLLVLAAVLRRGRITGDRIAGAVCVYLMLGFSWALLFGLVEVLQPGSFPASLELAGNPGDEYAFIYYSFVTLSTLGYGDIAPVSASARTFAWLEAVTGQLYLAVLVARMVALHILHSVEEEVEEDG